MKVLVIGNLTDQRCGFQNFTAQTLTALRRARAEVTSWDGTYPVIYERTQRKEPVFFPADVEDYDVIHLIWNAMTLNHYNGADWASLRRPVISWWDGGPSDASCPFIDWMQIRWSDYPRDGYLYLWYPVPDWIADLPEPDPTFTVGASSVRGDGVAAIRAICEAEGWAMNLPTPGQWVAGEDEIRRLARSHVNVCWYHTPPLWKNRASAPSMMIAARRPLVINADPLVEHLQGLSDIYHAPDDNSLDGLRATLQEIASTTPKQRIYPVVTFEQLSWTRAAQHFLSAWEHAIWRRGIYTKGSR